MQFTSYIKHNRNYQMRNIDVYLFKMIYKYLYKISLCPNATHYDVGYNNVIMVYIHTLI